jgi:hypothetical protein
MADRLRGQEAVGGGTFGQRAQGDLGRRLKRGGTDRERHGMHVEPGDPPVADRERQRARKGLELGGGWDGVQQGGEAPGPPRSSGSTEPPHAAALPRHGELHLPQVEKSIHRHDPGRRSIVRNAIPLRFREHLADLQLHGGAA